MNAYKYIPKFPALPRTLILSCKNFSKFAGSRTLSCIENDGASLIFLNTSTSKLYIHICTYIKSQ